MTDVSQLQFYPLDERLRMLPNVRQMYQAMIDEKLADDLKKKDRAEAALDQENEDELVRIIFGHEEA